MATFNYCGLKVQVCPIGNRTFYVWSGSHFQFKDCVTSDSLASRYPNLNQEDLYECICAIKRKYNLS